MQNRFRTAIVCFSALLPTCLHAEGIDTEHLFGFMIGSDVGSAGEREFQSQTTGRFPKVAVITGQSVRTSNWK
jgi:hypothetical protein